MSCALLWQVVAYKYRAVLTYGPQAEEQAASHYCEYLLPTYSLSVHASRGRRETLAPRFPRRSTRRQTAKLCGTTEQRSAGVGGVV